MNRAAIHSSKLTWRATAAVALAVSLTAALGAEIPLATLTAGYETAPLKATTFLAEAVVIDALVDDYNSTTNGETQYPVVADPRRVCISQDPLRPQE